MFIILWINRSIRNQVCNISSLHNMILTGLGHAILTTSSQLQLEFPEESHVPTWLFIGIVSSSILILPHMISNLPDYSKFL